MKKLALLIIVGFLGACVSQKPPAKLLAAPDDPKILNRVNQKGSSRIQGQAFMRQVGGGVVTAAGEKVGLFVATPYTEEAFATVKSGQSIDQSTDTLNFKQYIKTTTADAAGNFEFDQIPPGDYVVVTKVAWQVPQGRYGMSDEGGVLDQKVTVAPGQTAKIIMNR